ncbi:ParB/RepB/Spo0J family partition protein [Phyllobacterium sophorae]|nr:ParB/RepB/Spo0J family partition protein [Phyllobacterium sophorae]
MTKEQDFFTTLDKLVMSKNNVRADDESPVDTLAASLLNHGQISALVVEPDGKRYGVVAGGRRYRAFRDLLKRKLITKDFPIKVMFRRQGIDAAEISLAENVERKQMHPAEEAEIFRRLIEEEQASRDQLAERFGVPLHHINRRLKLAKVAPQIIAAYKGGELTLMQTEAFAITDDHQRQVDYFERSQDWNLRPDLIRKALTDSAASLDGSNIAKFVGRADYESAGGEIVTDLFNEDVFFKDNALLTRLAEEKLDRAAKAVARQEGWKWGLACLDYDYRVMERFGNIHGELVPVETPEALELKGKQDELNAQIDAQERALAAPYTNDDGEFLSDEAEEAYSMVYENDEKLSELYDERDTIAQLIGRAATIRRYKPDEIALAGIVCTIGHDGSVEVRRGLVEPEDKPRLAELQERARIRNNIIADRQTAGEEEAADSGSAEAPDESEITAEIERRKAERAATEEAEKEQQRELTADLSQALLGSLSLARTAALRATLADNQDVALRFGAYEFALHMRTAPMREHCPITEMHIGTSHLGEQAESLAGRAYEAHVERLRGGLPCDEQALWDTLMDASTDEIMDIIAVGVAGTIDAHTPQIDTFARSRKKWADNLADRLNLDMREWWTADAAFFGRVSKGVLVNAMAEAAPEITGIQNPQKRDIALAALAKLPKKELVDKAAEAMSGSGWLPAPLRTPKLESQVATAASLPAANEEAA